MILTKRSEREHAEECLLIKNSDRRNGWVISNRFLQRRFRKKKIVKM